jgi:hypothetical protein
VNVNRSEYRSNYFVKILDTRQSTRFDGCKISHMADLCQICNESETEVFQLDFQLYYNCWMNETNPEIFF